MSTPLSPLELTIRRINALKAEINRALDEGFQNAVEPTFQAMLDESDSGELAQRLDELDRAVEDIEAQQDDTNERRLLPTHPAVMALLFALATSQRRNTQRINNVASTAQELGIEAGVTLTRRLALLDLPNIPWNVVRPDVILAANDIINRQAFAVSLNNFNSYTLQVVRNTILEGMVSGTGARAIARRVREVVTTLPRSNAESLLRSVQLDSYRTASNMQMMANESVLEGHMRIAVLDDRTCMACIALHGTMLGLNEKVLDHRMGRCTSIPIVRNRPVRIQSGEDWLTSQSSERQQRIMGQAAYNAYNAGEVQIRDFVHFTQDPLFGEVVTAASLRGMIGDSASQYYARNNR